ncbi:MAG: hypothetical protein ACRC37_01400, partial [Lentisphaeria bacterium]
FIVKSLFIEFMSFVVDSLRYAKSFKCRYGFIIYDKKHKALNFYKKSDLNHCDDINLCYFLPR